MAAEGNEAGEVRQEQTYENLEEYAALIKFISTHREREDEVEEQDDDTEKKAPWYAPWKKGKKGAVAAFEVPEAWVQTPLNQGLTDAEAENRRKKTGFNEITSEKENMFLKFLSFFQGPVLYGK